MSGQQIPLKNEYDDFFPHSRLNFETRFFRHCISDEYEPIKIQMRQYEELDLKASDTETLLFAKKNEPIPQHLQESFLDTNDDPEEVRESMLEVPVSRLKREILQEIAEAKPEEDRVLAEQLAAATIIAPVNQTQNLLWIDRYMPQNFHELLSDEKTNRDVLTWLKAWDPVVFKDKPKRKFIKPEITEEKKVFQTYKNYINFDLNDAAACEILQNKIILLSGPPGSGKTTLARIIARMCGYNPIEINASDERTANILIERIESITKSETITKASTNYKPSLLILDEIDGTSESEYSGGMKRLIKYIYGEDDEFDRGQPRNVRMDRIKGFEKDATSSKDSKEINKKPGEGFKKPAYASSTFKNNQNKLKIKRPIICICNDHYAKGLKELRAKAILFNFKKPETSKLKTRLFEICLKEKLTVNHEILFKICEQNDNDIRSCLNMLDFLARKRTNKNLRDETFLAKKEMTKNLVDVIDDIIRIDRSSSTTHKNSNFNITTYCLSYLKRNTDYGTLSEGLFSNYTKGKNINSGMKKVMNFLDALIMSDSINKKVYSSQHFEMIKYTNLFAMQAHLNLATTEKLKIEFPRHIYELNKSKKYVDQMYETVYDSILPKYRPHHSKRFFPTEHISYIYQIIQPKIDTTMLNVKEKECLETAAHTMMDYGIELTSQPFEVSNRLGTLKVESRYKPPIERLLLFEDDSEKPDHGLEQRLNDKLHIILQNSFGMYRARRTAYLLLEEKDSEKKEAILSGKDMEENFFFGAKRTKKRKEMSGENGPGGFLFKYKEGFSNAVKYDVKMDFFFNMGHSSNKQNF